MNHRGLQRALFRMQLDASFAERLRAREPAAEASTRLGSAELECLRAADPAAVSADREGRRRAQLLRNASSELALSVAAARDPDWLETFPCSDHFHRAIADDAPLPLAFAAHAADCAASRSESLRSLVALETALARARRMLRPAAPRGDFALLLAPGAWLVEVADGSFAWAGALRLALDRGSSPPEPPRGLPPGSRETILIGAGEPSGGARLRPVRPERLEPAVADFLGACSAGLDARGIEAFCRARGLEAQAVVSVVDGLVGEGILLRPVTG